MITLNIGLKASSSERIINADTALALCYSLLPVRYFNGSRVEQSASEPTLIVSCTGIINAELKHAVYKLAERLDQDCIAIACESVDSVCNGSLVGARAAAWGKFNEEYFIRFNK